jgi:chitinase
MKPLSLVSLVLQLPLVLSAPLFAGCASDGTTVSTADGGSSCVSATGAPSGLSASAITSSGTALSWSAVSPPAGCRLEGYVVYENGTAIGTTSSTEYAVTGLSASTTYGFNVAASYATGPAAQSDAVRVTTLASTEPGSPGGPTGSGSGSGAGGSPGRLFAPYIDMSLVTSEQLLTIQQRSGIKVFTLAFIVDNGNCQASWGGLGQSIPNDSLPNGTTISSLVEGVRQAGGDVIISFGGAIGTDLSSACSSASQVQAMYQSVIDRYQVKLLDFDIEGFAASSPPAVDLRNQAVRGLKAANPGLIVSYTLPVLPTGLVDAGLNILDRAKSSGLDLDVVNVMAMDYGSANDNGGRMGLNAVSAATATEAQILNAGLSSSVGVTPMIGVNDTNTEIFGLSDAQMLVEFAQTHSYVSRLAIWSVSRDNGSCAGQTWASPLCSGITQDDYAFSRIFEGF